VRISEALFSIELMAFRGGLNVSPALNGILLDKYVEIMLESQCSPDRYCMNKGTYWSPLGPLNRKKG